MSWYSEYRNEWKEIIEAVARECKRAELMVEKDTVQSMFLLELSKIDLPFVFKGGTSLSKAYNLIDRFSEDIDLSMNRKPTQTERKASKEHIVEIAKSLGMELTNPFEAATVIMNVQSLERTFIDKIFAICDYRIQNMQDRDSRHLYDICKLLPVIKMDLKLDELIDTVRNDRMHSKNNPSAQLEYNIPEMLKEIISSRFYEPDYRNVTQKLLYEDISYDYAIENGIAVVAESEVFLYKKK